MTEMARGRWRNGAVPWLWFVLALVVAFGFLRPAVEKLAGAPSALEPFVEFGWPLWTAYLTAVGEIVGSVALIIPVTRTYGGLLLTLIMIGAGATNIANGHPDYLWVNAALLTGSLLLAWQGRPRRYRPADRRS